MAWEMLRWRYPLQVLLYLVALHRGTRFIRSWNQCNQIIEQIPHDPECGVFGQNHHDKLAKGRGLFEMNGIMHPLGRILREDPTLRRDLSARKQGLHVNPGG